MAIKNFENKSIKPGDDVTENGNSAIIETKEIEHCYPEQGVTIKAKSKEEADKKLKQLLS